MSADIDKEKDYRLPEAAVAAEITYRQMDYWRRRGFFGENYAEGDGSGVPLTMRGEDVIRVRQIGRLVRFGLRPERAAQIVSEAEWSLRGMEFRDVDDDNFVTVIFL